MMLFPRAAILLFVAATAASAQLQPPRQLLMEIAGRQDLAKARAAVIRQARADAAKPVIRRPMTFEALMAEPQASMKYEDKPTHQGKLTEEEWHRFALSLGDANINGTLATRLPRLAAAFLFTQDPRLAEAVRSQLAEMARWSPLERPGSVATRQNLSPAPWLGTGWAIQAITETLEIIPESEIPAELRQQLASNLETEILQTREAWRQQKLWYTKESGIYSNQAVLPMTGLVRAAIFTGLDRHRDDYEFGVSHLLRSLDAQGQAGEFAEGVSYAGLTMNALLSAAEVTSRNGDLRLIQHPYLKKFPIWYVHHLQPGDRLINAFDSKSPDLDPALLARFVAVTKSPEALWAIERDPKASFGNGLWGLIGRACADFPAKEPPLFGVYEVAAHLNWRDRWDDRTAAGFWLRGGHSTDSHDHQDRGHLSFSIGDRPILIEAGLESYGIPTRPTHFKSVAGHNVLQIGDAAPSALTPAVLKKAGQILDAKHRRAPITVERMDASGGAATVDASACYEGLERWVRKVTWSREGVVVHDEVILKAPEIVTFRWHLGAAAAGVSTIGSQSVTVDGIEVGFKGDSPVSAAIETMPGYDSKLKKTTEHACVVLRSSGPVRSLTLDSRIHLAGEYSSR